MQLNEIATGTSAPAVDWRELGEAKHVVQFYETDAFLLDGLRAYIGAALRAGEVGLVIATAPHRASLEQGLLADGLDVAAARAAGQYITLDAAELLSTFLVDGAPEPRRFAEVVGRVIERAGAGGRRVRVFGEMVALLWNEGKQTAALRLEDLWHELQQTAPFTLFCAYELAGFQGEALAQPLDEVCARHTRVIPAESYAALADPDARRRAITRLQQKAQSLDGAIAGRDAAELRLRALERRYRQLFDTATDGILLVDPGSYQIVEANPTVVQWLGCPRAQVLGQRLWQLGLFPDQAATVAALQAVHAQPLLRYETLPLRTPDGRRRDVEFIGLLNRDNGRSTIQCHLRDITARRRAEAAQRLLNEVGAVLAASLDPEATLTTIVRLVVPTLADYCVVDLVGADGGIRDVAVAHVDPEREAAMAAARRRIPPNPEQPNSVAARVIRTGRAELVPELTDAWYATFTMTSEQTAIARAAPTRSLLCVPLLARGHTLGALTLGSFQPDRYDAADLALAEALASRCGLALDNARLYVTERAARAQAEQAIRDRDAFLAVAAHELRTPVTSLRGYAQLLLRQIDKTGTVDPERLRRALSVVDEQSQRLTALVGQLLDVSRLEAGHLTLERQEVDLAALLQRVAALAQARAEQHTLFVQAPARLLARVDPLRLEQVLTNLLVNAIKYSPSGGPIEVELTVAEPSAVRVAVRDYGMGIPAERRAHIFDRFYRAHEDARVFGLGLGLFISREIVELHGGHLEAEFPADGGTRFVVSLPITSAPHAGQPPPSAEVVEPAADRMAS